MKITDQIGRQLEISKTPRRIVSCVPSITELIADMVGHDSLVGRTKFCVFPKSLQGQVETIGGTKNLNIEKIKALQPDLIIANKEENVQEQVEELFSITTVYVSDVKDMLDNNNMIRDLSLLLNNMEKGEQLINSINNEFQHLKEYTKSNGSTSCLYLIWKNPWMSVGGDTIINSIMNSCGLINVLENHLRYPSLSIDQIKVLNPHIVLLSSEPFPFNEQHKGEILEILPQAQVHTVDGTMFSWYGSRMKLAPDYLRSLIDVIQKVGK